MAGKKVIKKHQGLETRKNLIPTKYVPEHVAKIILKLVDKGYAIVCIGTANSPIEEISKGIQRSMYIPVYNGVAMFDSAVPFRKQYQRKIATIYINDFGNEVYIDSIRELDVKRSKTLYSHTYIGKRTFKKSSV